MKVVAKGLIDGAGTRGFGAVAVYQEIGDCLGILEPICVPRPQDTNAAPCDVSGSRVSPLEEATLGSCVESGCGGWSS